MDHTFLVLNKPVEDEAIVRRLTDTRKEPTSFPVISEDEVLVGIADRSYIDEYVIIRNFEDMVTLYRRYARGFLMSRPKWVVVKKEYLENRK